LKIAARHLLLATLASATLLAACSSDKPTAPSSGSLARLFDSAFVADSPGGHSFDNRPQIELALALTADEGLTPITVQLTTATGTLPMQMMALTWYDTTAAGTPSDSSVLVLGWTTDYQKYFALISTVSTGNGSPAGQVAPRRLTVTGNLASLDLGRGRGNRAEGTLSLDNGAAFVVDGDSSAQSGAPEGSITWSGASGHCSWQHVMVAREPADSTLACSEATVTTNFTVDFPKQAGVDSSLTQISLPSTAIPAVRLVGLN
jgi:hypothetical protein